MRPLAKFRVRPNNKALYYVVYVWNTLADLRKANPGNSHALALCKSWHHIYVRKRNARLSCNCGEVHFCKFHLRIGIITHEFCHAVIGWAARVSCIPDFTAIQDRPSGYFRRYDPDERFCHAHSEMVRQCVSELYLRKLIE